MWGFRQEYRRAAAPLLLLLAMTLLLPQQLLPTASAARWLQQDRSSTGSSKQHPWDPSIGVINGSRPLVISHRGSPGELPDHTLEGYRQAIHEGTDCIECDVVVTKDLKLICRHEPWLQNTTDALLKFPELERTYNIPEAGGPIKGIFSIDLTLAQVQQLRAANPLPWRDQSYNFKYMVPTFEQYVKLATDPSNPKVVCIYPETKHPTFFNTHPVLKAANTTIDDLLIAEMARLGYDMQAPIGSPAWLQQPAFIQSFEQNNLRYWKGKTKLPLVQLVDDVPAADTNNTPEYLLSEAGIKEIAEYAWGYAPWKGLYIVVDKNNSITSINTEPIKLANKYGMPVTTWTLRNEPSYLARQFKGNAANEYNLLFNLMGVDAGFSDHTAPLVHWVLHDYKPLPSIPANITSASQYATAGTPPWALAPVCQVAPTPSNPIVYDQQGHPWLFDRGVSCAYMHPVQFPNSGSRRMT